MLKFKKLIFAVIALLFAACAKVPNICNMKSIGSEPIDLQIVKYDKKRITKSENNNQFKKNKFTNSSKSNYERILKVVKNFAINSDRYYLKHPLMNKYVKSFEMDVAKYNSSGYEYDFALDFPLKEQIINVNLKGSFRPSFGAGALLNKLPMYKWLLVSLIMINLFTQTNAGPVLCFECIKDSPATVQILLLMCNGFVPMTPIWMGCVGAVLTANGAACMGLCALPGA
ncbi:MAG: hypothetical protein GY830_07390 [Bacteroidetes bacterium]|nr:hypothetical protein [Bacteroidota bacterium]